MSLINSLVVLFCATVVSCRFQVPLRATDDLDLKVPGNNPLSFEHDPKDYTLQLHQLDLEPNPPAPGKPLRIQATGHLAKVVDKGSFVHVAVKWGIVTILTKDFDLCESAGAVDEECPFHEGFWNVSKTVDLPQQIPPGTYKVEMQAYTNETMDEKIICMQGDVSFTF
ncbi:Phosphatidylglycerol phosphatidylinositol transfer [Hyphodiscus hymeniophilus]|uniref:Phosphatidylglycerol/phosphatidylinositol transfer protein n=1 Tax=Hyphodiscus hymeniophilus TaxID=353542 RepID=A0A9P6SLL7_9HELO|nr:Phosphatidylglycerol phosphatidylinositol transfer [Hyphodiscus hymeniophilus]